MKHSSIFIGSIFLLLIVGCASQVVTERLTLGTVQASLHEGMSQAEVQAALGAPNIVSKDAAGQEVWTYDKIYKQSESSSFFFWMSSINRNWPNHCLNS